jgi:hypothetical protein
MIKRMFRAEPQAPGSAGRSRHAHRIACGSALLLRNGYSEQIQSVQNVQSVQHKTAQNAHKTLLCAAPVFFLFFRGISMYNEKQRQFPSKDGMRIDPPARMYGKIKASKK